MTSKKSLSTPTDWPCTTSPKILEGVNKSSMTKIIGNHNGNPRKTNKSNPPIISDK
jgi:hypothetical protein